MTLSPTHPLNDGRTSSSALVLNLRGQRTQPSPIWFMRQAGRSLPEYRAVREGVPMLESCLTPDLVVEITLQPVRRHGVDAAIFFSDIVIPLKLAGVNVEIVPGTGPVVAQPVRTKQDFDALRHIDPDAAAPIREAVARLVEQLGSTPLIGFGGAPFTVASYLIEGGPSKGLPHSRAMMRDDPELWRSILDWCADVTGQFITAQVTSGASAIQVFDSWAGRLSPHEYDEFARPHTERLFAQLRALRDGDGIEVPRIHFGVGTKEILASMHAAGATAMGIDSDTNLSDANKALGGTVALQGNISPEILTADWAEIEGHVRSVIADGADAPGHVINLGHGVPPETDPDVLTRIVQLVHDETS